MELSMRQNFLCKIDQIQVVWEMKKAQPQLFLKISLTIAKDINVGQFIIKKFFF